MIRDLKQMTNGSTSVSNGAGGRLQLTDEWVRAVLTRLDPTSPAAIAVTDALRNNTLVAGIAGVDRATSKLTIIRDR